MKILSLASLSTRSFTLAAVASSVSWITLFAGLHLARAASAPELLEQGIYLEETKGELKAASEVYRRILDDPTANRSFVAQAHLRLGLCELKLGNKPQAISALERLTQEFPDKTVLLAIVEQHMPALLDQILKQIEQNYILEVDRSELMETAIRAIIGKLDAGRNLLRADDMAFLDANDTAKLNESLDQKLAGIGAALKWDEQTREVVVTTVLPRSPAVRAGVLAGDRIVGIDGTELPAEIKLERVVNLLRGPVGTAVTVTIKRGGAADLLKLELVRDVIQLATVKGRQYKPDQSWEFMLDDQKKIGYMRVEYLGRKTPEEMRLALNDLAARQMKALVLDLRSNPGGSLDEAIAVADLFVESGRIVTVKGRAGEKAYDAKAEGTFGGFPVAVLVNRKTASAAEIIAACLQDHQRAAVVGERTFGQGIVRTLVRLQGGLGTLKLPVAAYYRPSGKNVNRYANSAESDDWGVRPTEGYEVVLTDDEVKEYEMDRSAREILNPTTSKTPFHDRQLQTALEWVIAQLE
jgi:carboxyl-terminal processing protease